MSVEVEEANYGGWCQSASTPNVLAVALRGRTEREVLDMAGFMIFARRGMVEVRIEDDAAKRLQQLWRSIGNPRRVERVAA